MVCYRLALLQFAPYLLTAHLALIRDTVSKLLTSSSPPTISIPTSGETTAALAQPTITEPTSGILDNGLAEPLNSNVFTEPEPLPKIFGKVEDGAETKEPSDGDENTTDKISEEESESMGPPGESESSETVPSADSGEKDSTSEAEKPPDPEPDTKGD